MQRTLFPGLSVLLGLLVAGCGGISSPSNNQQVSLSGPIPVLGQHDTSFTVSKRGEVIATIKTLSGTPNGQLRMGIGVLQSGKCSPFANYISSVVVGQERNFFEIEKGSYCFTVFDPGVLAAPMQYTGTLSHP